jgi:hypothetical protein
MHPTCHVHVAGILRINILKRTKITTNGVPMVINFKDYTHSILDKNALKD